MPDRRSIMSGHQPQYIPSPQYFAKVRDADMFVFSDDVKFCGKEWQNRNRIIRPGNSGGWMWLTVPVMGGDDGGFICDKIIPSTGWQKLHSRSIRSAYCGRQWNKNGRLFLRDIADDIESTPDAMKLSQFTERLLSIIMEYLDIDTEWFSAFYDLEANASRYPNVSEKIFNQMRELDCPVYLSGISGPDYMDTSYFPEGSLYIHEWDPAQYDPPDPNFSLLDLIARKGKQAKDFLGKTSLRTWK